MMAMNNQYSAASLFDGGWRAEDRDQLIDEYQLTEEEADEICEGLREIEEMQKPGHYFTLDSEAKKLKDQIHRTNMSPLSSKQNMMLD